MEVEAVTTQRSRPAAQPGLGTAGERIESNQGPREGYLGGNWVGTMGKVLQAERTARGSHGVGRSQLGSGGQLTQFNLSRA